LSQNSKSKLEIYTDATADLIPQAAAGKAEAGKPRKASREKQEAEEPVYFNRV
jgi:hypothetical protein